MKQYVLEFCRFESHVKRHWRDWECSSVGRAIDCHVCGLSFNIQYWRERERVRERGRQIKSFLYSLNLQESLSPASSFSPTPWPGLCPLTVPLHHCVFTLPNNGCWFSKTKCALICGSSWTSTDLLPKPYNKTPHPPFPSNSECVSRAFLCPAFSRKDLHNSVLVNFIALFLFILMI